MSARRVGFGKNSWAVMTWIAILLLLTACGNNSNQAASGSAEQAVPTATGGTDQQSTGRTVKDGMDHDVTIPANPERILATYLEDHLAVLGVKPAAQWSVANGIQDYLQTDLQGVPTIGYDLPPEAVAGVAPDFILIGSSASVQNGLYEKYAKIAPTYVLGDELIKDWRQTLLKIGELLNKSAAAQQAIADYDQKAAETKAKLQPVVGTKKAAILWMTQKQFYIVDDKLASGSVLFGDLGMTSANLVTNLPAAAQATWNPVTLEKLAELDADYIFLVNSDQGQGDSMLQNPIWKNIPAVKAGQVHEMSTKSSWLYSGAIAGSQVMDDLVKTLNLK